MPDIPSPELIGIGLIGVVVGTVLGVLVMLVTQRRSGASRREIERLRDEHERYRAEVDRHFAKTSALFRELTERYRDLYDHMATGARQLCRDQAQVRVPEMAEKALPGEEDYAPGTEAPRSAAAEESAGSGDERSKRGEEESGSAS